MDKIDSKDQIFQNFKNNKMNILHCVFLITFLIFNNIKQFDYIKDDNVDDQEKSELPKFNLTKNIILSILASVALIYYFKLFEKSSLGIIFKNELFSNDSSLRYIINFPDLLIYFIFISFYIMFVLRALQYHQGSIYIEKNTYKNNPSGITLNKDDTIGINNNNFKVLSLDNSYEIFLPQNIFNNIYRLNNKGILYNDIQIFKFNSNNKNINKLGFEKNKLNLLDQNRNIIDSITFDNEIINFQKLRIHITNLGNLMILEHIEDSNENIPEVNDININLKDNYKILWQSGGNTLPVEEDKTTNILNNSYTEIGNKKLVSSTGSVYLGINENSISIKRYNDKIIWETKIKANQPLESVRISDNNRFQYRTKDSDTFIDIPVFSNIDIKYLELKNDGNLVAYNKYDESKWMSRKGLFNGKNFTDTTGIYLIYGLVFYLIEYFLIDKPWYIGFVRKLIRTFYIAIGFILMSSRIGLNFRNLFSFIFLFFFTIVYILWKTKNISKNSNKKGIIYIISFLVFAIIQVCFNLFRKFSIFPIDLTKKWTNEVDDLESHPSILFNFSNLNITSKFIFIVINILILLGLSVYFDVNVNNDYSTPSFLNKIISILRIIIPIYLLSFSQKNYNTEGKLIYANYHKFINFIAIIIGTLIVLSKLITSKEENLYYNYIFVAIIIFTISKYIEFPNIKFYHNNPTKEKDFSLTPSYLAKNNFIRILVLIVSFYFIYFNVMNNSNSDKKGKYSIIFLLFIGFLSTIISLVYQHLFNESKVPVFDYNSVLNEIDYVSWKNDSNNICYNKENFVCDKLNKKQIRLRDYTARIPLVISLIALIVYSIFKNNKYSFVVNSIFIVILLSLLAGINFAEAGNMFNLNIENINQDYSRISAPLFSFFISYANNAYMIVGITLAVISFLYLFFKTKVKDNFKDKMNLITTLGPIIIISLLFLAPLMNIIILTFKDEGLKSNKNFHDIAKKVLSSKFNSEVNNEGDVNTIKKISFFIPFVISSLFLLYLFKVAITNEGSVTNKGISLILVSGIFISSFIFGRFIGLSNTSPAELKPEIYTKIKTIRTLEKQAQEHLNIINSINNNDIEIPVENVNNLNKFFYIYFHGIDIINKYIILDSNKFIPPIYRIDFSSNNDINTVTKLQYAIYQKISTMKNFYKERYNVELNFNFTKKDNKFQFNLFNYGLKYNSGEDELININRGIKYNKKYLDQHFPKIDAYFSLMINKKNNDFYKNISSNLLKGSYYLDVNFDRFAILFDSNELIKNTNNNNINSNDNIIFINEVKNLALENLNYIKNNSSTYQDITTDCDIPNNSWIQLYNYYYYNKKYTNEVYDNIVFKKDTESSNLKNVLGFESVINFSTIYNSESRPENNQANNTDNGRKYNYSKLESSQEFTDKITVPNLSEGQNAYTRKDCIKQNDNFTDYNYNFRL